jgi:D-sedoheptulose 7-phosphate isomerase
MAHDIDRDLADAVSRAEWLRAHERAERTIERLAARVVTCIRAGGRVLTCGNGGSMCDAMHFAEELSGRYRKDPRALPAQAIGMGVLGHLGGDGGQLNPLCDPEPRRPRGHT